MMHGFIFVVTLYNVLKTLATAYEYEYMYFLQTRIMYSYYMYLVSHRSIAELHVQVG